MGFQENLQCIVQHGSTCKRQSPIRLAGQDAHEFR